VGDRVKTIIMDGTEGSTKTRSSKLTVYASIIYRVGGPNVRVSKYHLSPNRVVLNQLYLSIAIYLSVYTVLF